MHILRHYQALLWYTFLPTCEELTETVSGYLAQGNGFEIQSIVISIWKSGILPN